MALSNDIGAAQSRITKLTEEKAPLATELRKVEAEVGPIKYIAALIYGEEGSSDSTLLEKAVRWVTILIVSVFDPLAVVLLIAANWSLSHFRRKEQVDLPVAEPAPPIVETPLTTPKEEVVVEDSPKRKKVNKKEKPAPEWEIAPPPQPVNVDAPEHPDLVPGNQNWGSRPPEHLTPRRR
jgi:hypothetical protein